jgi:mono/diheme cytochrome c family protein
MQEFHLPDSASEPKPLPIAKAMLIAVTASLLALAAAFGFARILSHGMHNQPLAAVTVINPAPNSPQATQGRDLYLFNCAHCHSDDATGDEGPSLFDLNKSDARLHKLILDGIKGEMPAFRKKFNDADVLNLIAYLRTLKAAGAGAAKVTAR